METLAPKGVRRLGRALGDPCITRAWATDGGRTIRFVTWDHVHGQLDKRTGVVTDDDTHVPSCFDVDGVLLKGVDPFIDDGRWPATVFG